MRLGALDGLKMIIGKRLLESNESTGHGFSYPNGRKRKQLFVVFFSWQSLRVLYNLANYNS